MACSPSTSHHWDIPPRQFTGLFTTHPMGTSGMVGLGQPEGLVSIPSSSTPQLSLASILEEGQKWYPSTDPGRGLKYWGLTWNIERQGQILLSLGLLFGNPPWIHLLGSVPDLFQGQKWWAPENYCFDGNEPLGSYGLHQTMHLRIKRRGGLAKSPRCGPCQKRAPFWGIPEMVVSWWIWVCLKMRYTPNYSHLVGIMIINHWV